jgi:hypothetical protein
MRIPSPSTAFNSRYSTPALKEVALVSSTTSVVDQLQLKKLEINEQAIDDFSEKLESLTLHKALIKERAGSKQIAQTVADIMHNGSSDSVRLRAAELAANLAGINSGKESSNINIVIQGENLQLNNLFCPLRPTNSV